MSKLDIDDVSGSSEESETENDVKKEYEDKERSTPVPPEAER